jgi:hypothetical protein
MDVRYEYIKGISKSRPYFSAAATPLIEYLQGSELRKAKMGAIPQDVTFI